MLEKDLIAEGRQLARYFDKMAARNRGLARFIFHKWIICDNELGDASLIPWMFRLGLHLEAGLTGPHEAQASIHALEQDFRAVPGRLVEQDGQYVDSLSETIKVLKQVSIGELSLDEVLANASSVSVVLNDVVQSNHPIYNIPTQAGRCFGYTLMFPTIIRDTRYIVRKEYVQREDNERWFVTQMAFLRLVEEGRKIASFRLVRRLDEFPKCLQP